MGSADHDAKVMLAECDICQVEHCVDCDVVHVHVGHASLRLTLSGYFALCATLLEAARRVDRKIGMLVAPGARTGLQ